MKKNNPMVEYNDLIKLPTPVFEMLKDRSYGQA